MSVLHADCREGMRWFPDGMFDSCVTDPPYELTAARPGGRSEATRGAVMRGFMGMQWDGTGVAFDPDTWREVLRVLKPGAHLLAFGGTRTYHRMVCAIEDAGFEVHDQIGWAFGSGFPKHVSKLKPAWEPICMARKPAARATPLRIDECRVPAERATGWGGGGSKLHDGGLSREGGPPRPAAGRWPANLVHDGSDEVMGVFPDAVGQIADASSSSSSRKNQNVYGTMKRGNGRDGEPKPGARRGDAGSAARFFYCAKASKSDRGEGNTHPTVKPTDLMRWLCRLVTPPGGLVLDPFAGSGSTGKAARLEGLQFIGFEQSAEYAALANARIAA